MRIFKFSDNVHAAIAGEIINLLTSVQYFDDGKLLANPIKDYPNIIDGSTVYNIDIEKTAVYYPLGFDIEGQKAIIDRHVTELSKLLPESEKNKTYWQMKCDKSLLTVVRTKTQRSQMSTIHKNYKVQHFSPEFGYSLSQGRYERFMRDCSILIDTNDLVKLPHNALTYDVSINMFTGDSNISDVSITHNSLTNPIAFELNPKLKLKKIRFHSISKRINRIDLDRLNLTPVNLDGTKSIELCSVCTSPLYDDNYVFEGNIATSDMNERIVVCPLCAHYGTTYYDVNYFRIYIVKFPSTIHDIIDLHHTGEKSDVLHALVEKRRYYSLDNVKFIVLGKGDGRYIACDIPAEFVTSEAFKWFKNHKIVELK